MFNFGLYKEGLRKTKVWGVLFTIGMLFGAFIQPITHLANHAHSLRLAERYGWMSIDPIIHIRGLRAFSLMPVTFIVAIPLLTLSIFAFLNGRNSSDFFHAIPHKRETLFISFIASILTWSIGVLLVTTAISVTIYAVSTYTVMHFTSILLALLSVIVVSLLVTSGIMLAMTVTGTTLSNIAAAGLLLFLPRLLMAMFTELVLIRTLIIEFANFPVLFDPRYNLLLGFFANGLNFGGDVIPRILYTFLLGTIYLVVAGYLFKKRHSELATHPGSKWSKPIIRITATFTLTLPALTMILNRDGGIAIIIFYGIAIIGYFAYEVFTARKIHSLVKMLPGLGIVILLNIIFSLGVGIASNLFMREINTETISSAVVSWDFDHRFGFNHWGNSHIALNMHQLEITDPQVARLLGEDLNHNIRQAGYLDWSEGGGRVRVTFSFENGREMTRIVAVPWRSDFTTWLLDHESYRNLYLSFPKDFDHIWSSHNLTNEEARHVLDVLYAEIQEVDFAAWYRLVGHFSHDGWILDDEYDWEDHVEHRGHITTELLIDGRWYHNDFPITELTPLAFELYWYYAGRPSRD